ncbi:DoxX family protein [Kribbella shirazensis]|uniref:Putative membrane protein n=1 Tax=Kribbella shirazensis TaxID=1105143 RepID=A0A7X5ZZN7_9ACTN|nr:DoxX family protein [Kribbella shirazensis]NIK56376.1 putative membrane protein [Kribbella shirazensis]
MNLALWICAGLLAAVLLIGGVGKLIVPQQKMATMHNAGWTADVSAGFLKSLGAIEVLGAMGLVLPAVTDIAPVLVPVAAIGVVLLMVGAMLTHLRRHEAKAVVGTLVYLALAAFVAWGRFGPESFIG